MNEANTSQKYQLSELELKLLSEYYPDDNERRSAIARVEEGEPFAYVLGRWFFCCEEYILNEACLIPRSDTEHLVYAATKYAPSGGRICDLCTGSGCVLISTLAQRSDLSGIGVDISPRALEAAVQNASLNRVNKRALFRIGDALGEPFEPDEHFDIITANPPYIRKSVIPTLSAQVRREPLLALDGGDDGLNFYRALLVSCPPHLNEGGHILLELGFDQGDALRSLCGERGLNVNIVKDYGGNDRVADITL